MNRLMLLGLAAVILASCNAAPRSPGQIPSFYQSMARADATVDANAASEMIGSYRGNKGLGGLTVDPGLQAAALKEARAMAAADRPGSADAVKARLSSDGFKSPAANLSAGYYTLAEAFSGWRESPQHNRVLLDPKARRIGIATAYAPNSKYKVYWAMLVAAE